MNTATETSVQIPVESIIPSLLNPRKNVSSGDLAELAKSILEKGVLQPILVRPHPKTKGKYEVVCGERRLRASILSEQPTIPGTIREMTDAEALEAMIVENLQRSDVHYLDEAKGFKALLDGGQSQEDIAVKVGKDVGYVATRLNLNRLIKPMHKFAFDGSMGVSIALRLSRLTKEIQQAYLDANHSKDAGRDEQEFEEDDPREYIPLPETHSWGLKDIENWLRRNVYLRIADAPFDPASTTLVPKAGSCLVCPKRTGANLLLFAEFKDTDDTCTDKDCFNSKCEALVELRLKENPKAIKIVNTSRWFDQEEQKELKKRKILRPFSYDNKDGFRQSKKDACETTKLAVIALGLPKEIGTLTYICTDSNCRAHIETQQRDSRPASANREPGKISPERAKQVEEGWQRKIGRACRHAVHSAIRAAQDKIAATKPKDHPIAPIEALRFAVATACQAMRPQQDGALYLHELYLPDKKGDGKDWGAKKVIALIAKADQSTCLRMLLDFAIADSVANKFNTNRDLSERPSAYGPAQARRPDLAAIFGVNTKKVTKPIEEDLLAKKKIAYDKRAAKLKAELAKVKRAEEAKKPKKQTLDGSGLSQEEREARDKNTQGTRDGMAIGDGNYCRFCHCTEARACVLTEGPAGGAEACSWLEAPKKLKGKKGKYAPGVCSNPKCAIAFQNEKKAAKKAK